MFAVGPSATGPCIVIVDAKSHDVIVVANGTTVVC
jgi:hypothetical protein